MSLAWQPYAQVSLSYCGKAESRQPPTLRDMDLQASLFQAKASCPLLSRLGL